MGLLTPFGPRIGRIGPEQVQLIGYLRAWERPAAVPLAVFQSLSPAAMLTVVGRPAAQGINILVNAFYVALFNALGAVSTSTSLMTAAALSVGGSSPASVTRADAAMTGSELKRIPMSSVSVNSVDPPNVTLSYFSAAADGAMNIGEAGLWTSPTIGQGQLISHLAFSYNRPTNQDVSFDYTIARSLT
ncbi:MAG: hypothetical protein JWR37_2531 [Mycobacterium sp.]|nr:hypothetical protein [Mycobacterium sp.]